MRSKTQPQLLPSLPSLLHKTTSVLYVKRPKVHRKNSLSIFGATMRSNPVPIPTIRLVRPKSIIAVCVERCSLPSPPWTVTCWSIPGRDLSAVKGADRPSRLMEICIDTVGPMVVGIPGRAISVAGEARLASPSREDLLLQPVVRGDESERPA